MPKVFLYYLMIFISVSSSFAVQKTKVIQKLTTAEKELVEDSGISLEKLEQIVNADISIEEYFQYPWIQYEISEKEWIRQRQAGLISSDQISAQQIQSKEWAVVHNFFLPGFHQFKRHQFLKGYLMTGIAVATIALYAVHRDTNELDRTGFDYHSYLLLLGADLLWSSIDIGVQIHRELNKDADRFTFMNTEIQNYFNPFHFNPGTGNNVTNVSQ